MFSSKFSSSQPFQKNGGAFRRLAIWLVPALALLALAVGLGQPVAEAAAPEAPGAVTGLKLKATTTRVTATWTAPSPAPTGGYVAEIFEGDSTTALYDITPTNTRAQFVALKPGTSYRVSVKAQNKNADGTTGGPAVTKTTTTLNAPGAVTGLTLKATTTRVTATWTAPSPAPTARYVVDIFEGDSTDISTRKMTKKTKAAFVALKPGTTYKVSVKAQNKDRATGTIAGPAATATITTLSPPAAPGGVTDLSLTAKYYKRYGQHAITATWAEPSPAPSGKYFAQISEAGTGKVITAISRKSGSTRADFNFALKPGTSYRVSVTAQNKDENGTTAGPTAMETITTLSPPTPPGPVTDLALKVTSNSMLATWTRPSPAPTGKYLIELFEGDASKATKKILRKGTASKVRFIGLKADTSYKVSVTAHNKNDLGEVAGTAASATKNTSAASDGGLPDAPTNLTLLDVADKTTTTYTLRFQWDAASANGSDITHYIIVVTELDSNGKKVQSSRKQQSGSTTSFSFANAKIGTWYNLKIRAKNGVGVSPWAEDEVILE